MIIGQDVQNELRSFTATSPLPSLTMTSLQYPTSPDIYRPRYYHNDTHAFTANNLYKLKNEAELNANLIFFHDREQAHGSSQTSYFLPEGTQIIREDLRNRSTINQLESELRYNINKDQLYFNNLLELKGLLGTRGRYGIYQRGAGAADAPAILLCDEYLPLGTLG